MNQDEGTSLLGIAMLLFFVAFFLAFLLESSPPPEVFRVEVCRDKNGDVLSEKMLDKDFVPQYRTKGCQIEVREKKY
jgi:hypothetical protein